MAVGAGIRIAVLEGLFCGLHEVGVPFSVSLHLQERKLTFEKAQWTMKHTDSGFSVSFFWPTTEPASAPRRSKVRKPRKRRNKKMPREGSAAFDGPPTLKENTGERETRHNDDDPIDAHPCLTKAFPENAPADSLSVQGATSTPVLPTDLDSGPEAEGIDLMACKHVRFDVQSNTPGVCYQQGSDDEESWTPVVRRKRKVRRSKQVAGSSPETSGDEQLDMMNARQVLYRVREGIPGLSIRRGCTLSSVSWTPIAPTPIAMRTRARTKL